ncbi:MAG: endonuclease domain-containing protein [Acidiferrobacteraceae bacterium]
MWDYPEPTRPEPAQCEICNRPPTRKTLCLDHTHTELKKFRGWICQKCNTGIGMLGDDLAGLMRAVRYLQENG